MTIEELWEKMQVQMKNNNQELKEEIIQEIAGKMEADKKELKDEMQNIEKELKDEIHSIKNDIHMIKDVNLPHMLAYQEEMKKELKGILEEYIQKHDVEHKKNRLSISEFRMEK